MPLPSYADIVPYIEKGYVGMRPHPKNPDIAIFNYTHECQYEAAWDDITRACRGLVLNLKTGEVLTNPFPKFFNYQEHIQKEWPLPQGAPVISEKMDGSLGILVHVDDQACIATRGSFESEQAQWATNWWNDHVPVLSDQSNTITHLFEIIAPLSRVVVVYDYEGLVYLGSRVTATGERVDCYDLFERCGIRRVKQIPACDLESLAGMDEPNGEGFVCFYPESNERMKIKFPEYVRLHRIITGLNEIAIWERMRDGKGLDDLLEKVPDEFYEWIRTVTVKLQAAYDSIEREAKEQYSEVQASLPENCTRRDRALEIQKKSHRSILFSMMNGHDYADIIWKQIRPRGSHVFRNDIDA